MGGLEQATDFGHQVAISPPRSLDPVVDYFVGGIVGREAVPGFSIDGLGHVVDSLDGAHDVVEEAGIGAGRCRGAGEGKPETVGEELAVVLLVGRSSSVVAEEED